MPRAAVGIAAVLVTLLTATMDTSSAGQEQKFPDVVTVKVRPAGPDTFSFDVTVSCPCDTLLSLPPFLQPS